MDTSLNEVISKIVAADMAIHALTEDEIKCLSNETNILRNLKSLKSSINRFSKKSKSKASSLTFEDFDKIHADWGDW